MYSGRSEGRPTPKPQPRGSVRARVLKGDCVYCGASPAFSHIVFLSSLQEFISRLSLKNHESDSPHAQSARNKARFAQRGGSAGCGDEAQWQLPLCPSIADVCLMQFHYDATEAMHERQFHSSRNYLICSCMRTVMYYHFSNLLIHSDVH